MTVLTPPTTSAAGGNGPWPDCGIDWFGACTLEPGRDGRGEPEGAARVGLHLRLELQGRTDGGRHSAVVKVAVTAASLALRQHRPPTRCRILVRSHLNTKY